jgi:hypothetical protein
MTLQELHDLAAALLASGVSPSLKVVGEQNGEPTSLTEAGIHFGHFRKPAPNHKMIPQSYGTPETFLYLGSVGDAAWTDPDECTPEWLQVFKFDVDDAAGAVIDSILADSE